MRSGLHGSAADAGKTARIGMHPCECQNVTVLPGGPLRNLSMAVRIMGVTPATRHPVRIHGTTPRRDRRRGCSGLVRRDLPAFSQLASRFCLNQFDRAAELIERRLEISLVTF